MRALCTALLFVGCLGLPAPADLIVDYTQDAGGANPAPLNGLAARGFFDIDGTHLSILLQNTSTGVPDGFDAGASLLVSLGMNLPDGVDILSGDAAVIGPEATGIGAWSDRAAGASVAEQWIWTNDCGGNLMTDWRQVISTSSGQGSASVTRFDGGSGTVDGPFGGIAAAPPIVTIPGGQPAVSDTILFELTLTAPLSEEQLQGAVHGSIVEFGSDQRYLTTTPEPSALLLLALASLLGRRR